MLRTLYVLLVVASVGTYLYAEDIKYEGCKIQQVGRTFTDNGNLALNFICNEDAVSCVIHNDRKICHNEGVPVDVTKYLNESVRKPCPYPYKDGTPLCHCIFSSMDFSDRVFNVIVHQIRKKTPDCGGIEIKDPVSGEVMIFNIPSR